MTILLGRDALGERTRIARGALSPLVASLRADLAQVIARGTPFVPAEKARLTRRGGRCPTHGILLDFDPWSPHAHRCPQCNEVFTGEEHYRWWIMNYQLWLAERAVHGAVLHAVEGSEPAGRLASEILDRYADAYLTYPNADNVLGPTRPFFSTYLESIWLLQLSIALDVLESSAAPDSMRALGGRVRERVIEPSARLIASYDEGRSNRQVWNAAAMAAAGDALGDAAMLEAAISGPSGLEVHARASLLADGTWYEGENYHLFAHRGLWYLATIAAAQGWSAPPDVAHRLAEGFATPFASALPDLTFPSRRDSQYRVSLRQWRIAESCELGLARRDDERLSAALGRLYREDVVAGDSGRWRSTAEAERNVPPVRLSRAELGWKSLLFARETLPLVADRPPSSALLPAQGLGILRRDRGRVYVALDYGESGGGHGHPDRLNLWLVVGDARVLEDVGTGSYVDPSLHWYRSTLAHNAPLIDGRSQWRVDGELIAWDEQGDAGWVSATAELVPGVRVRRSVVVMDSYLVDELQWESDRVFTLDLPWHVDATFDGAERFCQEALGGGHASEDGFPYVAQAEVRRGDRPVTVHARIGDANVRAWIGVDAPHEWWRCVAPGPPGEESRPFVLMRTRARHGTMRAVWSWGRDVSACEVEGERIVVHLRDDAFHTHGRDGATWTVDVVGAGRTRSVTLAGLRHGEPASESAAVEPGVEPNAEALDALTVPVLPVIDDDPGALIRATRVDGDRAAHRRGRAPLAFPLGRENYRRSEPTWEEAGGPHGLVALAADAERLVIEVEVVKRPLAFAPLHEENPLDNELADINSDGVQLYLSVPHGGGTYHGWLLVPEPVGERVRVTPLSVFGRTVRLQARWRETASGYLLRCEIPRTALGDEGGADFSLDLIVNETVPTRERRRGQLVLSGGRGEWVYLRGDRQEASRAIAFHIHAD